MSKYYLHFLHERVVGVTDQARREGKGGGSLFFSIFPYLKIQGSIVQFWFRLFTHNQYTIV